MTAIERQFGNQRVDVVIARTESGSPIEVLADIAPLVPTTTRVPGSDTSALLLAANPARRGYEVYNEALVDLYLSYGNPANTTNYYVIVPSRRHYVEERRVVAAIHGVWAATDGAAQITEYV